MGQPDLSDDLRRETGDVAARWYARLHADDVTDADRMHLHRWRISDPANARAWDAIARVDDRLTTMPDDPVVRALLDQVRPVHDAPPVRAWRSYATLAAVMLTVATPATWVIVGRTAPARPGGAAFAIDRVHQLRLGNDAGPATAPRPAGMISPLAKGSSPDGFHLWPAVDRSTNAVGHGNVRAATVKSPVLQQVPAGEAPCCHL